MGVEDCNAEHRWWLKKKNISAFTPLLSCFPTANYSIPTTIRNVWWKYREPKRFAIISVSLVMPCLTCIHKWNTHDLTLRICHPKIPLGLTVQSHQPPAEQTRTHIPSAETIYASSRAYLPSKHPNRRSLDDDDGWGGGEAWSTVNIFCRMQSHRVVHFHNRFAWKWCVKEAAKKWTE